MQPIKSTELFVQYVNSLDYLLTQSREITISDRTVIQMYFMALDNLFGKEKQDFINRFGDDIKRIQLKIMVDSTQEILNNPNKNE